MNFYVVVIVTAIDFARLPNTWVERDYVLPDGHDEWAEPEPIRVPSLGGATGDLMVEVWSGPSPVYNWHPNSGRLLAQGPLAAGTSAWAAEADESGTVGHVRLKDGSGRPVHAAPVAFDDDTCVEDGTVAIAFEFGN